MNCLKTYFLLKKYIYNIYDKNLNVLFYMNQSSFVKIALTTVQHLIHVIKLVSSGA